MKAKKDHPRSPKKRGAGEGSISKLPDGRWCAFVSLGFRNGKRWRQKVEALTRNEVVQKMRELKDAHAVGVVPESQTVGVYLARWLEQSVKPTTRPRTHESYAQLVRLYIVPNIGHVRLSKLGPQHVQAMLNHLAVPRPKLKDETAAEAKRGKGTLTKDVLSARTIQYVRAVLRRALNQAKRWRLVAFNAAELVEPPKTKRAQHSVLAADQWAVFGAAVETNRLRGLYLATAGLGLRQGEAFGLRWSDIDFEAATVAVVRAYQDGEFVETKSDKGRRLLPLPLFVREALVRHRAVQLAERELAGSRWHDSDLVFTSSIGTPLIQSNVLHGFQRVLKAAGLPKMRFHDLRHQCATVLLQQGVHPKVVSEILGHSQISLTRDTYSHVSLAMKAEAAPKLDAFFGTKPAVATVVATVDASGKPN